MKEEIINILKNNKEPLDAITINDLLKLESVSDYKKVLQTLEELTFDGIVHQTKKDKYILLENLHSIKTGYVHIMRYGDAKVECENGEIYKVDKENLNYAIEGDFVEIDVQSEKVIINKILKRDLGGLVGEIVNDNGELKVVLDDQKKNIYIDITKSSLEHCVEGHKVIINIIKEIGNNRYLGEVSKILGHKNDPGVDILSIAARHEIHLDFSNETLKEVSNMPTKVGEEDIKNRTDLRDEIIFTIDGDDTKDIDDAISIKKEGNDYLLGVHIADVSYYVKEGSALFADAKEKGTSSYLADTVLPMLPHELSNGICSLNENEDRLAISCIMRFDDKGKRKDFDIFPSVIRSRKKMTYKNVNKILMENFVPDGYEEYKDDLLLMKELSDKLHDVKRARGLIEFYEHEGKIVQDKDGKAIDVVKRFQLDGENLIENFMIAANETVASYIENMDLPFVYRVEGDPDPKKIEQFSLLLKALHINYNVDTNNITPYNIQNIIDNIKDYSKYPILSSYLLRCMQKAVYSSSNIGHYGLGSKAYTHFTSPIRRFPDLMVHTLLHKYVFEKDYSQVNYYQENLEQMCLDASERERSSDSAEREVFDMKCAEYMEGFIGEEFEGIITGITNFGIFVELPNLVEGLIPLSNLEGRYQFVQNIFSLCKDGNICYTVGDKINVVVTASSKETAKIDFMDSRELTRKKGR